MNTKTTATHVQYIFHVICPRKLASYRRTNIYEHQHRHIYTGVLRNQNTPFGPIFPVRTLRTWSITFLHLTTVLGSKVFMLQPVHKFKSGIWLITRPSVSCNARGYPVSGHQYMCNYYDYKCVLSQYRGRVYFSIIPARYLSKDNSYEWNKNSSAQGFSELIHRIQFSHFVFLSFFFFVSWTKRHIIPKSSPRVYDNLQKYFFFSNLIVIHEYLPMLDPILWRLGAKICPVLVLTFKVAQGQIQ